MAKLIAASLLGIAAMAGAHGHRSPARPTAETGVSAAAREAAAAVDRFHQALRRGDAATAATLLAEDATIFESGEVERTRADYVARHLPADIEFSKAVPSTVTHRTSQSDSSTAWIASEGRMTGSFKGKPVDRLSTETMILRRTAAGWRIVHIHWSSAAAH